MYNFGNRDSFQSFNPGFPPPIQNPFSMGSPPFSNSTTPFSNNTIPFSNNATLFSNNAAPYSQNTTPYSNNLVNPLAAARGGNSEKTSNEQYGFRDNVYRANFNIENLGQNQKSFKEVHSVSYLSSAPSQFNLGDGLKSTNYTGNYKSGNPQLIANPMAKFQKSAQPPPTTVGQAYASPNINALDPTVKVVEQYVPPPLPKPSPVMQNDQQKIISELMNDNQEVDKQTLMDLSNLGKVVYSLALRASSTSQEYNDTLKNLKRSKSQFTDQDFPPNKSSIAPPSDQGKYRDVVSWKRPSEIFKNPELFEGIIEPNDILQGNLGDCYLLSTLAAIAENPERIKNIFLSHNYSPEGIYVVQICWRGAHTEVIIDDFIAVDKKNEPYFLKSKNQELWVIILEKAWAKLHRNYHQIDGQLTKEALHDFTGAPVRSFRTNRDHEQLWQRMVEANQNKFIMTAGTEGDDCGAGDPLRKFGLVSGHAYSLIGAYNLKLNNGSTARLIKVRNPWGEFEWSGKWNDKDTLWNSVSGSEKSRIGFNNEDDGIFFLEYSNMLEFFDAFQICYYHDDYCYSGIKVYSSHKDSKYLKITINKPGNFYWNISQMTIRYFDLDYQDSPNSHYSDTNFAIADSNGKVLQSFSGRKRDLYSPKYIDKPFEFPAGTYYAYVRVQWQKCATHFFGFGCYGPGIAEITEIQPSEAKDLPKQVQPWENNRYPQFDIEQIVFI